MNEVKLDNFLQKAMHNVHNLSLKGISGFYPVTYRFQYRIEVRIADDPMSCVAVGTGKALDNLDVLQRSAMNKTKEVIYLKTQRLSHLEIAFFKANKL